MSITPARAREIYARTILALAPYADDIVFIGGWAHAFLLDQVGSSRPRVATTDIDVTLPRQLPAGERPSLRECIARAGYEIDWFGEEEAMRFPHAEAAESGVSLDLLVDFDSPRVPVPIAGQSDLLVHGYPSQHILLAHTMPILVGPEFHPMLTPAQTIRIPTPGAYVLVKGLSSRSRYEGRSAMTEQKYAKDIVYLLEVMQEPALAGRVHDEFPRLAAAYPSDCAAWRDWLTTVLRDRAILEDVARQYTDKAGRPVTTVDPTLGIRDRLGAVLRDTPGR